jgi:hypothetical protein
MYQTPQVEHLAMELESASGVLSERSPASWTAYLALESPSFGVASLLTAAALIVPLLLFWAVRRYRKMQEQNRVPFRFLDLPQELRDMVYEQLIEDPAYPPPSKCPKHASAMDWMLPSRFSYSPCAPQRPKRSNWILLVNKQIYTEYMDLLCKRATFHLTVSPENYKNPCATPTTLSTPSFERIWKIAPDTLKKVRACDLKLITTSAMLGVSDPRKMNSAEWTLARQIRRELSSLTNVPNLTLDARAIGDPLWNPLWIWYHACQSFKDMGTSTSDTGKVGPELTRITFSLDTWSPGENYLARDVGSKGEWTWYCMEGHDVGVDGGPDMTVREFCGMLYQGCRICRPEMESEDEGE